MKPFKFKLDGLLKIRKFKEETHKIELGKVIKEINRLKDEITQLNKDIEVGYQSQENVLKESTDGKLAQFYPYFFQSKWEHIKARENEIYSLERKLERMMREMEQIMADVKVIENLKDKKIEDYKKELNKKELEKIDEQMIIKGNKILSKS